MLLCQSIWQVPLLFCIYALKSQDNRTATTTTTKRFLSVFCSYCMDSFLPLFACVPRLKSSFMFLSTLFSPQKPNVLHRFRHRNQYIMFFFPLTRRLHFVAFFAKCFLHFILYRICAACRKSFSSFVGWFVRSVISSVHFNILLLPNIFISYI